MGFIKLWVDRLLTVIFLASCLWSMVTFIRFDQEKGAYFAVVLVGVILLCQLSTYTFDRFGDYLSNGPLSEAPYNRPLSSPVTKRKWMDQSWQLVVHSLVAGIEVYIFTEETWLTDTKTMWSPTHPREHTFTPIVHFVYLLQLAIWMYTAFSHKFLEENHMDYFVMYLHHVMTIFMVVTSYHYNYYRVGLVVLFIHDISDITVDLLKMVNYLKLDGAHSYFLVEIIFVVNLVQWIYWRLYVYPVKILYSCIWESLAYTDNDIPLYTQSNILMVTLEFLHIWWTFLFLRIAYKLLLGKKGSDVGDEEYEGEFIVDEIAHAKKLAEAKKLQGKNKAE